MKVIVAGYAKTGTKSLSIALSELGYNVYDYLENLEYLGGNWKKILQQGTGCVEDFKRMYEDVDAAIDGPVYLFWEEIHQAFPDAKIILTTRDVDAWYKGWVGQTAEYNNSWFFHLAMLLTPKGRKYFAHTKMIATWTFGEKMRAPFLSYHRNEMLSKKLFRRHNSYVLQKAPKDKLLVYSIKEGWEPLCRFLGKEVPDKPFPRVNVGGSVVKHFLDTHPYMEQMKKELCISVSAIASLVAVASYLAYKRLRPV